VSGALDQISLHLPTPMNRLQKDCRWSFLMALVLQAGISRAYWLMGASESHSQGSIGFLA